MFVVDTNILVYARNPKAPENKPARNFLEKCLNQSEPWHLTWGIVYEFLRIATHPKVFSKPLNISEAWTDVEVWLSSDSLSILTQSQRHPAIAAEVFNSAPDLAGNIVFDARTAILMREHGIRRIYTRDRNFERFDFIEVINPIDP